MKRRLAALLTVATLAAPAFAQTVAPAAPAVPVPVGGQMIATLRATILGSTRAFSARASISAARTAES